MNNRIQTADFNFDNNSYVIKKECIDKLFFFCVMICLKMVNLRLSYF